MSSEQIQRQHLADVVNARMAVLDLTNETIGDADGPSTTTMSKIRNATTDNVSPSTLRKLDTGLRWRPGSARLVALGGQPVELPAAWDAADMAAEVRRSNLRPETKATVLRLLGASREETA